MTAIANDGTVYTVGTGTNGELADGKYTTSFTSYSWKCITKNKRYKHSYGRK